MYGESFNVLMIMFRVETISFYDVHNCTSCDIYASAQHSVTGG